MLEESSFLVARLIPTSATPDPCEKCLVNLLHVNLLSRPRFSLCLMLGLGAYSSSTDDDSDADEGGKVEDHSDWEPEHVLKVSSARVSNNNSQFFFDLFRRGSD